VRISTSSKVADARYGEVLQLRQYQVYEYPACQFNLVEVLDTARSSVLSDPRKVVGDILRCRSLVAHCRGFHSHYRWGAAELRMIVVWLDARQ